MPIFEASIQHDEKTLEALAHMQYDLFCKDNRIGRTILSVAAIVLGIVNSEAWWGILAIAYGCYLTTSTYASANHTAHKLSNQIRAAGLPFPASRYEFTETGMNVITMPEQKQLGEPLAYGDMCGLGEDRDAFYVFRSRTGGYMIPKSELWDEDAFREFLERKTGKRVERRMAPAARLIRKLQNKQRKPYRL